MTPDKEYLDTLHTDGATAAAWELVSLFLFKWRHDHPDDDRGDLELLLADDTMPDKRPPPG